MAACVFVNMRVKDTFGYTQPSPLLLLASSMALMGPGLYPRSPGGAPGGLVGAPGGRDAYVLVDGLLAHTGDFGG